MSTFTRTFLPAAADAGLDIGTIGRHLPVFRRCVGSDAVVLVARCTRADRPYCGAYVLTLTRHRLVITRESRVVHRLRLHLDAPLSELSDVTWAADPTGTILLFSATAIDGVRERFAIRLRHRGSYEQLDRTLARIFGNPARPLAVAA